MASSAETIERPVWRGWMHAVAFFCSLPAGFTLVALADGAAASAVEPGCRRGGGSLRHDERTKNEKSR